MEHYSFWSILPPILAIVLAIKTRQVFVSLLFGIWLGWLILSGGNIIDGTTATVQALVDVFKEPGNTRTIMFSSLVGALIAFIQRSGGVEGFVNRYVCETEESQIVCITEHVEGGSGMRARLTMKIHDAYSFDEIFELASPGKELEVYFTNRWSRRPTLR